MALAYTYYRGGNKEHNIQKIKTPVLKKIAKETGNFPQVLNALEVINQNVFNKTRKVRLQEQNNTLKTNTATISDF